MEPLQDSPQPGCWSPARSPDNTQKDLHVVLQVAGAPELTLALAPQCPAPPSLSLAAGLFCRLAAASTPLVHPWLSTLPCWAFRGPPLNLNVGRSGSGRSCCLLCTRTVLFSGQASGGQATRAPTLQQWSPQQLSGHPAVNCGITPSSLQHCSSGSRRPQQLGGHPAVNFGITFKSGIYTQSSAQATAAGSIQRLPFWRED